MRGALANGAEVKAARQAHGLTQEQVAVRAGVDQKTIRKAGQSKRLDLGTLTKLGFALDVPLSQFIQPGGSARDTEIHRRDVVLKWRRAFDAYDADGVVSVYHDNAVLHMPGEPLIPFGGRYRGRDEIRWAHETVWGTCSTKPARQEDFSLLVSDNIATLHGHKGVHPPNGEPMQLWWVHIFTFDSHHIVDHRVGFDTLHLALLFKFPIAEGRSENT